jgi:DNA-binding transcriptional ArsR family regulator
MQHSEHLDSTFAALADSTRRAILARLAKGDAAVNELAKPFAMSQPAISKHLRVLERAGLIERSKDAQRRPRRLQAKPLAEASRWLEKYRAFWEGNYQRLDALLLAMQVGDPESEKLETQIRSGRTDRSARPQTTRKGRKRQ